ncbi:HSP70/90 co-chaperone [Vanrija albida]|uniref:HSP70/90 co-chaperone n=1 Tax=Vanrija albida TaxID=181172 RepID=A0ABR3Q443_9TREE
MAESTKPTSAGAAAPAPDSIDKILGAMTSARSSGPAVKDRKPVTYEEFQAVLDSTPLFMKETPVGMEDDYVLEALKTLVFDGDGDEVALNFKNHGNELYSQKSYKDAVAAYTQGLDAHPSDPKLRATLLNNRAACNVALRNYGQVLKDTSAIIALAATRGEPAPPKALYRAAQALVALDKWDEAEDVIQRGRQLPGEEGNKAWGEVAALCEGSKRRVLGNAERERRAPLKKAALARAVVARGLVVVNTASPPDNPHPLDFDPAAVPDIPVYPPSKAEGWVPAPASTPLVFPVFLLYPQHNMSDLITHFHEDTSFEDQLGAIFPATAGASSPPWSEWDQKHEYYVDNLAVYVETAQKRLLKVGKEITLREVLAKAQLPPKDGKPRDGVVLRDGLLSFVVLVKGTEERQWIDNFKKARDGK